MHPFRFGAQLGATDADEWRRQLSSAAELGYSIVTLADHFGGRLAPLPALAMAAEVVDIRIGTLVLANDFRHPAIVAKEGATLDCLSGGRFELGIGAGWFEDDYQGSGIRLDEPGTRVDRLEEAITVIKGLWADGRLEHGGRHYTVSLDGRPKPTQKPRPPILIAGGARRILGLAGREADIVGISVRLDEGKRSQLDHGVVSASREMIQEKLAWIRSGAGDRFDRLELNVLVFEAHLTSSPEEVLETIARRTRTDPAVVRDSPQVLIGSVEEICETMEQRRSDYGISYYSFYEPDLRKMAPVVERLAGR